MPVARQAVLRPYRKKGTLSDFIRLSSDIDPAHIQGAALAAASSYSMDRLAQARENNRQTDKCYTYGKPGHFARECPQKGQSRSPPASAPKVEQGARQCAPGICPQCRRGRHWSNECQSQHDAFRNLIQGNGRQGQHWPCQINGGLDNTTTSNSPKPSQSTLQQLCGAMPRITGLDLSPASRYILTPEVDRKRFPPVYGGLFPQGPWG